MAQCRAWQQAGGARARVPWGAGEWELTLLDSVQRAPECVFDGESANAWVAVSTLLYLVRSSFTDNVDRRLREGTFGGRTDVGRWSGQRAAVEDRRCNAGGRGERS